MTEAEIRKYDPEDLELKELLGDKFHDDAQSKPVMGKFERVCPNTTPTANMAHMPTCAAVEEEKEDEWTPVKPDFYDNLKQCAKTALIFGGLNGLLFYWEMTGLMAESIAVPSMCVCAALFGLGIGKVVGGKK